MFTSVLVDNLRRSLVDLPGFGYAKVSREQRTRFEQMIQTYLEFREPLFAAALLCDVRRDPQDEERGFLDFVRSLDLTPIVVVTKTDKASVPELSRTLQQVLATIKKPVVNKVGWGLGQTTKKLTRFCWGDN